MRPWSAPPSLALRWPRRAARGRLRWRSARGPTRRPWLRCAQWRRCACTGAAPRQGPWGAQWPRPWARLAQRQRRSHRHRCPAAAGSARAGRAARLQLALALALAQRPPTSQPCCCQRSRPPPAPRSSPSTPPRSASLCPCRRPRSCWRGWQGRQGRQGRGAARALWRSRRGLRWSPLQCPCCTATGCGAGRRSPGTPAARQPARALRPPPAAAPKPASPLGAPPPPPLPLQATPPAPLPPPPPPPPPPPLRKSLWPQCRGGTWCAPFSRWALATCPASWTPPPWRAQPR